MPAPWVCEYPDHEGNRLIKNKYDRFSKRITYVRSDGSLRLNEFTVPGGRMCRACVPKDAAKMQDGNGEPVPEAPTLL
jgi:hypothetical protein